MPSENYAWLPTVASAPRKKNSKAALKHRSCIIPKKITSTPEWEIAGIYADDGISGVHTKKRDGFNQMIQDCKKRKIDLILTKSISRFARNTLDSIQYVRMLKALGIAVIFEKRKLDMNFDYLFRSSYMPV